jgi:hypothetical protein
VTNSHKKPSQKGLLKLSQTSPIVPAVSQPSRISFKQNCDFDEFFNLMHIPMYKMGHTVSTFWGVYMELEVFIAILQQT